MKSLSLVRNREYQEVQPADFEGLVNVLLTRHPTELKQDYNK